MGRFVNGITTGVFIGATVGMMVVPQLDRSTRKKIRRSGKMAMNIAGDVYESMMNLKR